MVSPDLVGVDRELRSGGLSCGGCGGSLRPWGWARERLVRCRDHDERVRPRRSRCPGCAATHVLLPVTCLLRRVDEVEVIGAALLAKAAGAGHRPIAARLGRPATTVREWLRRFAVLAGRWRALFTRLALRLDPSLNPPDPSGSGFADAVTAIGVATSAGVRLVGRRDPWRLAAKITGGRLLWAGSINTTSPWETIV